MPEIVVREARPEDYAAMAKMLSKAYRGPPWNLRTPGRRWRLYFGGYKKTRAEEGRIRLVAEEVAGFRGMRRRRIVGLMEGRLDSKASSAIPAEIREREGIPAIVFNIHRVFIHHSKNAYERAAILAPLLKAFTQRFHELRSASERPEQFDTLLATTHPENQSAVRLISKPANAPEGTIPLLLRGFNEVHRSTRTSGMTGRKKRVYQVAYFIRKL